MTGDHVRMANMTLTGGTIGIFLFNAVLTAGSFMWGHLFGQAGSPSVTNGQAFLVLSFIGSFIALALNGYGQLLKIREPSAVVRCEKLEADALQREEKYKAEIAQREEKYKVEIAQRDEARKELEARVTEFEAKCHRLEDQNTEVLKQLNQLTLHVLEAKGFIATMSGEIPVPTNAPSQAPAPPPRA